MRRVLAFASVVLIASLVSSPKLSAQSLTTGAIVGTVTDPSGAVVSNAELTATNVETGQERTSTTGSNGTYTISQLGPGRYQLSVSAAGFKVAVLGPIAVAVSRTASADVSLEVGEQTQVVQVTGQPQILEPANPNTTTTITSQMIAGLPNPGNDLSYIAQIAPGAIMNTRGGSAATGTGNVEFNGLPVTSTNWTIDGLDANHPLGGGNINGAADLMLGLNAVSEASINTLSYSVDQGRYGAAQVNYISKSGTNNWHGNAFETWNGSSMNAADWFLNAQPGPPCSATNSAKCKPFSNVNQFGGSLGGPIIKNKLFFFGDLEDLRIVLPLTQIENFPSQAYENYVLNQIPLGGFDPRNGRSYAPPPNPSVAIQYYKQAFSVYGNPPGGVPVPTADCPIKGDGTIIALAPGVPTPHGTGCRLNRIFGASANTHDLYIKPRVDHEIGPSDRVWYAFTYETGVQASYVDPVSPIFNVNSPQLENWGSIGYTHVFSPNLVNEFNPGYNWDSWIFQPADLAAAKKASPFGFGGAGLSNVFGRAYLASTGDKITTWQLIDNLTWTRSDHTLKFGGNFLRKLISDHNFGYLSIPNMNLGDAVQYSLDVVGSFARHTFAPSLSEPIGAASLDLYAQDTWKARRNLTVSYGLRATWNSNPVSQHNHFSRPAASFDEIPHDVNQPLNQVTLIGQHFEFPGTTAIVWQPRAAIAWQAGPKTVLRVGAGVFSDAFGSIGQLTDAALANFPNWNFFSAGAPGSPNPIIATYAVPGSGNGVPGSPNNDALGNIAQANAALVAGFQNGVLSCAANNAPANCLPTSSAWFAVPTGTFKYPYFAEWSATVQQQFGRDWMARVQYVGTKATNLAYTIQGANGFQTVCQGCFAPYPYGKSPDGRFGYVTQQLAGTNSSYNALQATVEKRFSRGLTIRANYTWSHCLDEQSQSGTLPSELGWGDCDYDVRHSFNGLWVYQLPSFTRGRFSHFAKGWEIDGNVFLHTGFPVSVYSEIYGANGNGLFQGSAPGGGGYALPVPGVNQYAKWQKLNTQTPGLAEIQWLNPSAFTSVVDPNTGSCTAGETFDSAGNVLATNDNSKTCQFGGRSNVFAPGFFWTDIAIARNFNLTERVKLRIDAKFYNAFNHMNPGFPGNSFIAGVPAASNTLSDAFAINYAASPPTSLLGSGLGGDSSVRMIALSGRIEF
jgi:Carboxypeptidase regulatory-like domain